MELTHRAADAAAATAWLHRSGLLDARPDAALDRLTRLAARICRAPIGVVALCTGDSLLFKSTHGLPGSLAAPGEVPLHATLCREPIRTGRPLIVDDVNAGVSLPPESPAALLGVCAYAAVPLTRASGEVVGTFAVMDTRQRSWTDEDVETLCDLSASVLTEIESRIDAAERDRAVDALRQSEERFRLMVEGGDEVFFYTHDLEGRFGYVSPSVQRVLGYTPDELVGRRYHSLLTGDASDAAVEALTAGALSGNGRPSNYTAVVRHRDGHDTVLELVESALRQRERITGIQGFARDITERRRAEDELRVRTASLEHLIESTPEAIVVLDTDERVLRINREFTRTFGYPAEEAVGRHLSELIVPDGEQADAARLSGSVAAGETIAVRAVRRRRDGSPLHVSILATPVVVDGNQKAIYGIYRDISEQVRAEERIRRSEEYFRSLIEHSADVIDILSPDGTLRYTTPSIRRVLGYEPEAVIGRNVFDFVHPDDRERLIESFQRDQELFDGSRITEVRIRHGDGSWRHFEAAARNLLANPAVGGIVITSRDVTDRREAAAELQRNAAILDAIRDAVIVTDPHGRVTYWNAGATRLFGWTEEEMLGATLGSHVPADMRPRFERELQRVLAGEEITGEYEDVRKDDSRILTDTRVSLIRDAAGAPAAVLRIARDITEQRLLGRVLEEIPDAVVCLDASNRIVSCNAAALRTFGYSSDELVGQPIELLAPDTAPQPTVPMPEIVSTTRACGGWCGDVLWRRKDGSLFPIRLTTGVVRDSQGRIIGQVGLLHDLTEERLREAQMRRADRMTSLGTLLGGLAHELNNPLTSIKSFAQLLLLDERPDEDRDGLEVIHQEADRAAQLVTDLRLLARQTREMAAPVREAVDLDDLVRQVVLPRRAAAEAESIRVREDLASGARPVWGDRFRLEQMIRQLVLNAEQALRSAGVPGELTLRTRGTDTSVVLEVIDSGPGIEPADLERVFDPFWTTKDPGEGIGLGLSLVHTVVSEHGGEVRAESAPGEGAVFTVALPVATGDGPAVDLPDDDPASLRILLVEDEPAIRTSLARFLERRGHRVEVAEHGTEALRRLEQGEVYEVIVSDLRMPGLSGAELYERVVGRAGAGKQKMIFVTGDPELAAREGLPDAADLPVVTKPFELPALAELIERTAAAG